MNLFSFLRMWCGWLAQVVITTLCLFAYTLRWSFSFITPFAYTRGVLVGPSGLEPPTSCLSGTRSNHLSYEPIYCLRQWYLLRRWNHFLMKSLRMKSSLRSGFGFLAAARSSGGGDDGIRTHDPLLAGQVLSQLSYTPILGSEEWRVKSEKWFSLSFILLCHRSLFFSWKILQNWTTT